MRPENVTHSFVSAFVEELARSGVRHVCAAPGSRSTPLAMVLESHPDIKLWMHLDERCASFFALGVAKAGREPVGLLCTSGTAAANFYPAVIEAQQARVPLVVLTADRPPELQGVGAPQTIDQIRMYGSHVKWTAEVPLPEAGADMLRYIRTLAGRAVATARSAPAGPVHLNFPFREPLVPVPERAFLYTESIKAAPYVRVTEGPRIPEGDALQRLAADLSGMERGLIVCGPQTDRALPEEVVDLARTLGYPVLADPLSQVRCGRHDRTLVIDAYDAFLRDGQGADLLPDVVIRFGAMPTSKPLTTYLQWQRCRQIVVDGGDGWNDPTMRATDVWHEDEVGLCRALCGALPGRSATDWTATWLRINDVTRQTMAARLSRMEEPFEGKVFAELADLLPEGATLYAGNSMPVRDLDSFFPSTEKEIRFLSNRGANGIDGVVSSALGASAVAAGRLVLAIGDLSFYHDMNGLWAARRHGLDVTVVLLNNDGGGIFSFLPQASEVDQQFETLFGTPHGLDFRPAVEMYGGSFLRADTWEGFRAALERSLRSGGLTVVEVPTDRARNVEQHRAVWRDVAAALERDLKGAAV